MRVRSGPRAMAMVVMLLMEAILEGGGDLPLFLVLTFQLVYENCYWVQLTVIYHLLFY